MRFTGVIIYPFVIIIFITIRPSSVDFKSFIALDTPLLIITGYDNSARLFGIGFSVISALNRLDSRFVVTKQRIARKALNLFGENLHAAGKGENQR